ncbi:fungal-specific transcription factor domain-containing protein [Aspergillus carlsbadensis]|nr:fungal-specific transcription factor domain-containing protein [Aspergillus carlsbadensis]
MSTPVRIAPAPANASGRGASRALVNHGSVSYTCQTCTRRKVKCDKLLPVCSRCRKANLECCYQPPRPRQKRRLSEGTTELREKVARYEHVLRENGLFNAETPPTGFAELPQLAQTEPQRTSPGTLLGEQETSRYIGSHLWRSLGDEEMQRMSEDAENPNGHGNENMPEFGFDRAPDPFTDSFLNFESPAQSLVQYHPTSEAATVLWETFLSNVEPLCKILHIPSTRKMVEMAQQQPQLVSKADECILFSIYHFAVFSMTEEECITNLGQGRNALLQRYHHAARRAFVNASFLRTTSMSILQALVLFLMPCRHIYDSHTYWILTGIAVRIGQRIGLHRDAEKLNLPPFQVEMRRRLFYHLLPLDSSAAQISGIGISITPGAWDTKLPLNINDDELWPEMTELPREKNGATEMTFCLSRFCVGKHLSRVGGPADLESSSNFKDIAEAELSVSEAETEVEEKFIRYCDVLNPVHFLTMSLARAGLMAMRLKIRLPSIRNQTATDEEVKQALHLAVKIMDTDTAIHGQENIMKRFRWHIRPFFVWGTWDSFILILTTLWKRHDLLSPVERAAAWERVGKLYGNHDDLLGAKPALNAGFRRLTLRAWDSQPPANTIQVPEFIKALRSECQTSLRSQAVGESGRLHRRKRDALVVDGHDTSAHLSIHQGATAPDIWDGLDMESVDWATWDQFLQEDPCL